MGDRTEFDEALERTERALRSMAQGDAALYYDCWVHSEADTLFGGWGTMEQGEADIAATLDWVAGRFGGGTLYPTYEEIFVGAELAYTVGFERGTLHVDGELVSDFFVRVTHVYARTHDRGWRILHRHADHPPVTSLHGS